VGYSSIGPLLLATAVPTALIGHVLGMACTIIGSGYALLTAIVFCLACRVAGRRKASLAVKTEPDSAVGYCAGLVPRLCMMLSVILDRVS
jgi:hypothetical protein